MRKLNLFKIFVFLFIILITSTIIFSYIPFKAKQITHNSSNQIEVYLENISETPAYLNEFLDFEWDTVHILGPYLPNKHKHGAVGATWYTNPTYLGFLLDKILYDGEILSDGFQELIFLSKDHVVSTALIERTYGDFLVLDSRVFSKDRGKFKIQLSEFNYREIVHVD